MHPGLFFFRGAALPGSDVVNGGADTSVAVLLTSYFCLFFVAAWLLRRRRPHWRRTLLHSACGASASAALPFLPDGGGASPMSVREWWPLVPLLLGYWAPAGLAGRPNEALERWLLSVDRRLGWIGGAGPHDGPLDAVLESSYLFVYPMVPAALIAVLATAGPGAAPEFWQRVLLATLPCYALLPVLPTRPPRDLESPVRGTATRAMTLVFTARLSNRWNTFPSGHAAGAVAVAWSVTAAGSPIGPLFWLLAAAIVVATVRGRYHYAVDSAVGIAWAIAVCAAS